MNQVINQWTILRILYQAGMKLFAVLVSFGQSPAATRIDHYHAPLATERALTTIKFFTRVSRSGGWTTGRVTIRTYRRQNRLRGVFRGWRQEEGGGHGRRFCPLVLHARWFDCSGTADSPTTCFQRISEINWYSTHDKYMRSKVCAELWTTKVGALRLPSQTGAQPWFQDGWKERAVVGVRIWVIRIIWLLEFCPSLTPCPWLLLVLLVLVIKT